MCGQLSPLSSHVLSLRKPRDASKTAGRFFWPALSPAPSFVPSSSLQIFHSKHARSAKRAERYVSGNSLYFRMNRILDIYFVGGFGTVQVRWPRKRGGGVGGHAQGMGCGHEYNAGRGAGKGAQW
jgi:hypothetical protein